MDTKGMLLWGGFLVVCAVIFLFSRKIKRETEENGIETVGVVSRIETTGDAEDMTVQYYVKYHTQDGVEIEGILSNPNESLREGQQVRLKYHPKYQQNAMLIVS